MVAALGGELVTYMPWNGVPRTFKAVIDRQPTQIGLVSAVAFPEHSLQVVVPKDGTNGVLTIHKGKDRMTFKRHLSDTQETEFTVAMILQEDTGLVSSDSGAFTLVVK